MKITPLNAGTWGAARRTMEVERIVCRALRGGTVAMRSMGETFLPRDFRERSKPQEYTARLLRTFLFPGFDNAVGDLAAKPFQRALRVEGSDGLSPELAIIETDADREGTPLTSLAHGLLETMWDAGVGVILVDKPSITVTNEDGTTRAMTRAEEAVGDVRPYFVPIHPDSLIDWSYRVDNGRRVLEMVKILEESQATNAKGDDVTVQTVRVWTEKEMQHWERVVSSSQAPSGSVDGPADLLLTARQAWIRTQADDKAPYTLKNKIPHGLGIVPIVVRNMKRGAVDQLRAEPPLRGLAWKNIEDWQIGSAENNNLHWHAYPLFFVTGISKAETDSEIAFGPGATLTSSSPDAKIGFTETSGAAAQQLAAKRDKLRQEMQSMGLAPFSEPSGNGTATGSAIDESRTQTRAQAAVEDLEWLIYSAYEVAAMWQGDELPEDFDIEIFRDFSLAANAARNVQELGAARGRGDVSRETYLRELQRNDILDRDIDVEEELQRIDEEGPALGDMLPPPAVGAAPFGGAPDPANPDPQPSPDVAAQA